MNEYCQLLLLLLLKHFTFYCVIVFVSIVPAAVEKPYAQEKLSTSADIGPWVIGLWKKNSSNFCKDKLNENLDSLCCKEVDHQMIELGKPPIIKRSNEEKIVLTLEPYAPLENPHEIDAIQALPGKFMSW